MDSIEDYQAASSPVIDYQMGSLLYRLPQELRDQIYSHLFASTRLSRGTRQSTSTPPTPTPSPSPSPATTTATTTTTRVKPDPNALAILRTCRRACYEISDSWIRQVSFHFEQPAALLDTLTALPQTTRAQIRRVRVGARKLELGFPGSKFRACYGLASTLKLVPGLNLDVLTVLGSSGGDGDGLRHDYETLDGLVREGSGWRELRFISKSSALLGYANVVPSFLALDEDDGGGGGGGGAGARECRFWRKPQPAHWRGVMNERDGEVAEPSVMVYRARQRQQQQPWRGCCGVLDEKTRETYEQEVPQGRMAMEDFGIWGDKVLLADGGREKEMLIVVRRGGAGVEYEEKEGSPLITGDIRQEMGGIDWEAMRRDHIDALEEMCVVEDGIEFDEYDDVDEYVWPTICREPGTNIYAGI